MYEKLLKEEKDKQNQQNSQDNKKQQDSQNNQENQKDDKNQQNDKGQSEKDDVGHDTHGMWENAIEDRKKEKSEEEKTEFSELEGKGVLERIKKERKKQFKEFNKKLINESAQEVKDEKEKIGQGKKISDIGVAVPLIDWRRRLRQATKYKEEYTMRNSRLKNGLFTYRVEQIPIPETEILLDVSGSVSEILLRNFLRECKNILSESQVKVGCFNTQFYGFTKLRSTKDIDNMTFPIGGGTDFNVAVEAFSRNIPNKIIFTDGLAPMPKKTERNVIWVVYGKEKFYPKGGEVINIIGEQLKKLCELHVETKEVMSK